MFAAGCNFKATAIPTLARISFWMLGQKFTCGITLFHADAKLTKLIVVLVSIWQSD